MNRVNHENCAFWHPWDYSYMENQWTYNKEKLDSWVLISAGSSCAFKLKNSHIEIVSKNDVRKITDFIIQMLIIDMSKIIQKLGYYDFT